MKTIIFIHGVESFAQEKDYQDFLQNTFAPRNAMPWEDFTKPDWRIPIARAWTNQGGRVYYPTMPNKQNARYADWKIIFEEILTKLSSEDEITFIGGSLGGCFLLKYFGEQNLPFVIPTKEESALNNGADASYLSMTKSNLQIQQVHLIAACIEAGNFTAPTNYEVLKSLGDKVHIWHAEDDPVVPFETAKELEKILPEARTHFFNAEKGYGHFYGIENIPELETILL